MPRTALIAGNWKMNGLAADLDFFDAIAGPAASSPADVLICPPATLLAAAAARCADTGISVGGQDCHAHEAGAHTGDISAAMLKDAGARYVILGHSERRADHGESDAMIRAKADAVLAAGLIPIICVGETKAEREAGKAQAVVTAQLAGSLPDNPQNMELVIAYEPVWAIGTGLTASVSDVEEMHAAIRAALPEPLTTRILYGGSVKPANAESLLALPDVDGALVGGASLKASDFTSIINAAGR
ncbi:triose-phosphate isomerase [Maricaulis parjimensis]|uniref:triose-phosphate isomerase n=1 Tax=Maricaulis parjimensis TaxID=144023 RepID=UPI0019398D18|nr:triose-phosphate isomerase [Maricaulis parjimensis]